MNRAVIVHLLCTLSKQTLAVPDVDMKLKLPDSNLMNHLGQDMCIYIYLCVREICLPQNVCTAETFCMTRY